VSGTRRWVPVAPIAVVVTGVLAFAAVTLQGPQLRAHLANQTQPDRAAVQAAVDRVLATDPITFPPNATEPAGTEAIPRLAGILSAAPAGLSFEVGGHVAPGPGDKAAALQLSQARADAVAKALAAAGVPAERLTAKGYGDTRPAGTGAGRRVDITVR
jgi:outer membrane protein OmpA-like peptidoglycan-associated protein